MNLLSSQEEPESRVVSLTCPRCGTKKVSFWILCDHKVNGSTRESVGVCKHCNRTAILCEVDQYGSTTDTYVLPRKLRTMPRGLPKEISAPYREAQDARTHGLLSAASIMLRKATERGIRHVLAHHPDTDPSGLPKPPKVNLSSLIDLAKGKTLLTEDLALAAHRIRIFGNDGAHEDSVFSSDEVNAAERVATLLLTVLFEIPFDLQKIQDAPSESSRQANGG